MNRKELRRRARVKLDDEVYPGLWSDEFLNAALETAVREANLRARLLVDSITPAVTQITIVPGVATYRLHPSVIVVRRAEFAGSLSHTRPAPLCRRSFDELDRAHPHWRTMEGAAPHVSVQDMDQHAITLHPIPTEAGTLRLTVWRHPLDGEAMDADADEPPIPPHYRQSLVDWVCYDAYTNAEGDLRNDAFASSHISKFEAEFGSRPSVQTLRALAVDRVDETEPYWY